MRGLTGTEPDTYTEDNIPKCITEHKGFGQNCTAEYSLETAYITYRIQYGKKDTAKKTIEE